MAARVPTATRPASARPHEVAPARSVTDVTVVDESVGELVSRQAAALGERVYAEDARSDAVATFASLEHWRRALAAGPFTAGTTVAVSIADPLSCAAAVVGALAAGLWVAPLDPAVPDAGPSGLQSLLTRTGAQAVLADRPSGAAGMPPWVELESLTPDAAASGDATEPVATGGVVLSSSGTTGPPKVARLAQSRLLHTARCVLAHHELSADDRCFNSLPLFHINAEVVALLSSLVAGSSLVLDDGFHRTDFWALMGRRRITWINAVPAIIARLAELRAGEVVPAGIRFIRSASAPLPVAAADRFEETTGIPVIETYGMTEAASQITAHPLSVPRRAGSVGQPVGIELRVVHDDDTSATNPTECGPAEVGEVEIRGPSVIDRYAGGAHGDRFRSGGWLRTGDLGWRDGDGFVYLVARSDDVINRGGEKIFPREIEEVVTADPAVVAVAVAGRDDPELGQVPVVFVVLDGVESSGDALAAGPVVERINRALACGLVRARRPVVLHVVGALPTGATGKVRRRALTEGNITILHTFTGV